MPCPVPRGLRLPRLPVFSYDLAMTLITDIVSQPRLKLSFDDVLAMMEKRIIDPTQKYELIDGVIYQMAAEGSKHIDVKSSIIRHLGRTLSDDIFIGADATLRLSPSDAPSPDVYVSPASIPTSELRPEDVLLVIEVSETSLGDDLGPKADLYAAHGVQEYWVVDIEREMVLVHRECEGERWAAPEAVSAEDFAICAKVPELKLRLADLRR